MTNKKTWRPSALPKIAECPKYVGMDGDPSEAASRGTRIDALIRAMLRGEAVAGEPEELAVAEKAVVRVGSICGVWPILTQERDCELAVPSLDLAGTADIICPGVGVVIDIKTGQRRNYREQMAAYSLACMDRFQRNRWSAVVLYVDDDYQQEYEWTRTEAWLIVNRLRESQKNDPPRQCEYCGWCANGPAGAATCPTVTSALAPASDALQLPSDLAQVKAILLSDAGAAGRFRRAMKIAEKLLDAIDAKAKADGEWVPTGYRLQRRAGARRFDQSRLPDVVTRIGVDAVMRCASINGGKLLAEVEAAGALDDLAEAWVQGGDVTAIVEEKNK